jgi:hypothetical protein
VPFADGGFPRAWRRTDGHAVDTLRSLWQCSAYLSAFDLKLSSARGLFARRRMGKTEFLQRDLLPAAVERGYLVGYTNLRDNRSAPESALESALTNALEQQGVNAALAKLRKPVGRVKATAKIPSGAEGSLEAELVQGNTNSAVALREVLKRLDRQEKQLLLVIDEAQVMARADHSDFAHALGATLDIRKDRIKVIFAGSSETRFREMFARSSEPFYNWAALEPFPLPGDEFVAFTVDVMNSMARRMLTLNQAKRAFDFAPHPGVIQEVHRTVHASPDPGRESSVGLHEGCGVFGRALPQAVD